MTGRTLMHCKACTVREGAFDLTLEGLQVWAEQANCGAGAARFHCWDDSNS